MTMRFPWRRLSVKRLLCFAITCLLTFAMLQTARDAAATPESWRDSDYTNAKGSEDTLTIAVPKYPKESEEKGRYEGKNSHAAKSQEGKNSHDTTSHEGKDSHDTNSHEGKNSHDTNSPEGKNSHNINSHEGKNSHDTNSHEGKNSHKGKTSHAAAHTVKCDCAFERRVTDFLLSKEYEKKIARLNATMLELLESSHPNLPASFLHRRGLAGGCDLLPSQFDIDWHNTVWQEAEAGVEEAAAAGVEEAAAGVRASESILLYSAFYDPRTGSGQPPCVRILGMSRRENPDSMWCQLWFDARDAPVAVRVAGVDHIDYHAKDPSYPMPFLFTCPLPAPVAPLPPPAVSLAPSPCRPATNALKVVGGRERASSAFVGEQGGKDPPTWSVAVCGPALFYYNEDFSDRLIEWLETLRAMGVAKVFLYETDVAPTLSQVLRHYEQDGLVSTLPYSYPPPYPNHPATRWIWRHLESENYFSQENVYFSDCVLRHMHEYRFIAHFDPDEVPVLPHHQTLPGLVAELLRTSSGKAYPAYNLQMINFYEDLPPVEEVRDLPPFLWVLRHTARLKEDPAFVTGHSKPIFDMDFARGVFSHAPVTCVGMCEAVKRVSPSLAYLGHFKGTCGEKCQDKDLLKTETAHLRHRDLVLQAVTSVKKKLQLV